jgi:hypothetical protein
VPSAHRACAPQSERPRIVLDESLTPTEAGLPALSADGTEVALAVSDTETASSSLSVRFVRTEDAETLREAVIVSREEALALEDSDAPDAALRARVEARVTDLDAALASGGFQPLQSTSFSATTTRATTRLTATTAALTLDFDPATRTLLALADDGHERLRSTLEPREARCAGRATSVAPVPSIAWLDARRGVLVVRVHFATEARCVAPSSIERVLRLAP